MRLQPSGKSTLPGKPIPEPPSCSPASTPNHPCSDRPQVSLPSLRGRGWAGSNLPTQAAGCPTPGPSAISQPLSHSPRSVAPPSLSRTQPSPLTFSRKACLRRPPAKLLAGESCCPSPLSSLHPQPPALAGASNLPTVCQTQPRRVHQLSAGVGVWAPWEAGSALCRTCPPPPGPRCCPDHE